MPVDYLRCGTLVALLLAHAPLQAEPAPALVKLVNDFRHAPAQCRGLASPPVARLAHVEALSRVVIGPGTVLVAALDQAGYDAQQADSIHVTGPGDAHAAFEALRPSYCVTLRDRSYRAIGASRSGNSWSVILARPTPELKLELPAWPQAGQAILAATNRARSQARQCGARRFAAAPPLAWSDPLALAALAHSTDMSEHRFFSHAGRDGRDVGARARSTGYDWRRVGENIASGQASVAEAVAGWLESPGHCANLMNPAFTEMGAAYALRAGRRPAAYWTQVFGSR